LNVKRFYYDNEGYYKVKMVNGRKMLFNYPAKNPVPYVHEFYSLMEHGQFSAVNVNGV
jgi:hypothetical protein